MNLPAVKDEALVLKLVTLGESDLIVHILTKTGGKRSVIAKAAKKSRKRFVGALQPFSYIAVNMFLKRTKPLCRLDSADCLNSFPEIQKDLQKIYTASYFCELLDALLVEGETYPEVFELFHFFLRRLCKSQASIKHRLFFELRVLDMLGYCPDLIHSDDDGNLLEVNCYFNTQSLSFNQNNLLQHSTISVSKQSLETMKEIIAVPMHGLRFVKLNVKCAKEILAITKILIECHTGRKLKTLEFLED